MSLVPSVSKLGKLVV